MKHFVPKPDLAGIFNSKSEEERREERYLAFEAEFDINRPFEVEWSSADKYLIYKGGIYFYKPQYDGRWTDSSFSELVDSEHSAAVFESESPHFYAYRFE
jgi:hypothetical protein